jgi:ribokinase
VRAFVVGNAVWDETLRLDALPRPGASVHVRRGLAGPGGKGLNQAVVLARAGLPTTLVAVVGRDASGERIVEALAAEGLNRGLIRRTGKATDWSAVLVTPDGENAVLTTREAAESLGDLVVREGLGPAAAGDLCVMQGNLSLGASATAIRTARKRGMTVAFNPSPSEARYVDLFGETDLLFLNRIEALACAGSLAPEALRALGAGQVVVTLGAEGAMLVAAEGEETVPASPARPVDPTGAGDAFMAAALAHAAPRGWRLDGAALAAGAAAAALTVGREGAFAALPSREEMAAIIGPR